MVEKISLNRIETFFDIKACMHGKITNFNLTYNREIIDGKMFYRNDKKRRSVTPISLLEHVRMWDMCSLHTF